MSRTKSTFRNLFWALLAEIVILGIGLIMPRLIIISYGSTINGLTATINQIINILFLLQAGAVGASIFALFKPVAEEDYDAISEILYSSRKYFQKLGIIFLLAIFIIAPVLAYNNSINELKPIEILLAFIILGLNTSLSFFFISYFDILFSSHQERYILSIASIFEKISYYVILLIVISSKLHFLVMYLSIIFGTIVKVIFLYSRFKKKYSSRILVTSYKRKLKIRNRGYLLANQISTQAVESSPTILIAVYYNLKTASVFSIYYLVMSMIRLVINTMQISISEIFGNLVVSEDSAKVNYIFNLMQFIYTIIGFLLITTATFFFMPFITLYTDGITDINYILPKLSIYAVLFLVVYCIYMPIYTITNVYGFYKQSYLQSIISGIIAIFIGLTISFHFTVDYILFGLLFYYLTSVIYRIFLIRFNLEWLDLSKMIIRSGLLVLSPIGAYHLQKVIKLNITSYILLLQYLIIYIIILILCTVIYIIAFEKHEYLDVRDYFVRYVKNRR